MCRMCFRYMNFLILPESDLLSLYWCNERIIGNSHTSNKSNYLCIHIDYLDVWRIHCLK